MATIRLGRLAIVLGALSVAPVLADSTVSGAQGNVVRILDLLNVADPLAIQNELPFFKRSPLEKKSSFYGFGGTGFLVAEPGLILTNAHVVSFDEGDVKNALSTFARRKLKFLLGESSTTEADKTAISADFDATLAKIPQAAKGLLDRKAIFQEIYAVRRVKDTVEFWPAQPAKNNNRDDLDGVRDVALLRAEGFKGRPLRLNLTEVAAGEKVIALGYPNKRDTQANDAVEKWFTDGKKLIETSPTDDLKRFAELNQTSGEVTRRVVRSWRKDQLQMPILENDAKVTPGDSGGPLVNQAGQVVGLITMFEDEPNSDFAAGALESAEIARALHEWEVDPRTSAGHPLSMQSLLLVAIGGVALIGIAALIIAFRKPSGPGRTTVMGWVAGAQGPAPGGFQPRPPVGWAPEPPSLPRDSLSGFTDDLPNPNSRRFEPSRTVEPSRPVADPVTGRFKTAVAQTRPGFESFELRPEGAGQVIELDGGRFAKQNGRLIMGRSADLAHVQVDDRNVSKRHAAVRIRGERLYIEDLESANGTQVNGKKLEPYRDMLIEPGDTITIGKLSFRLRLARP